MPLEEVLLREVLDAGAVTPLFQPVVDLDRMAVAGYEALSRGPAGPLHTPNALLDAARASSHLVELDWLCRETAVRAARARGLRHPLTLFINAEPETLLGAATDKERWASFGDLRCYAELTERALAAQPSALLRAVEQVREQDWGIALDDVGSAPESLALLPLLQPDIIKLDLSLVQARAGDPHDLGVARILHATLAQATATGAALVVEGIETEEQLDLARAFGAQYGQGFLLGRPAPLPDPLVTPSAAVPLLPRLMDRSIAPGAFAVVASAVPTRRLPREALLEVARQLLAQACVLDPQPVVMVCANDDDLLPDSLAGLLAGLRGLALVGLVGSPACTKRVPQVRTRELDATDPARDDFDVVVVSPHYAATLVSRPALSEPGRYDAVLTFERPLAVTAANALTRRLEPS